LNHFDEKGIEDDVYAHSARIGVAQVLGFRRIMRFDSRFVFKEWKALRFWFYGIFKKKLKTLRFTGF
jgi:hypothetical protein